MWGPIVTSWFIHPLTSSFISTINHRIHQVIHQLNAIVWGSHIVYIYIYHFRAIDDCLGP